MNMGKTMAVTDAIDALVAEAYRRMRDAGLSHVEAAEYLKRWEGVGFKILGQRIAPSSCRVALAAWRCCSQCVALRPW